MQVFQVSKKKAEKSRTLSDLCGREHEFFYMIFTLIQQWDPQQILPTTVYL